MNSNVQNLPIFKHFDQSQIQNNLNSFKPGEKGLFNIIKLLFIGGLGYLSWVYVLPPLFKALGQIIAIGGTIAAVVALVLLAPVIFKGIRRFTRFLHKLVIRQDPFGELEEQKEKMVDNKKKFQMSKGKISGLKSDMEISAAESQKNASDYQKKILQLSSKAKSLKNEMDQMEKESGVRAKGDDSYVNKHSELLKTVSEAGRLEHQLNQENDFVTKYGSRAAILKKFDQKLTLVGTAVDIKILDFDATIEILKKDYAFAQKSKEATDSAKSALMFTKGWEVEYALDVVTSTIAQDIAITTGNLQDIDILTSSYSMDSDELYTNLELLSEKISSGGELVNDASKYNKVDYEFTSDDRVKSGGFDKFM